jgi:hypothetical protein
MRKRNWTILDHWVPSEQHLPLRARTWARLVCLRSPECEILELRDPNDGSSRDPADKRRHQYLVARERLWHRTLPPAPLDAPDDEARWRDEPQDPLAPRTASAWSLVEPGSGLPWEWAALAPYATTPQPVHGTWDLSRTGPVETIGYRMPPRDPFDPSADLTDASCPYPACQHPLVQDDIGSGPGSYVCLRPRGERDHPDSIRHRWQWLEGILVLIPPMVSNT